MVDDAAREWVSFEDPEEDRTWLFDVSFLASSWHCIYGAGCQGVLTAPAAELVQGCCSYGAHFAGKKDLAHVERVAKTLTDAQWQFRARARAKGITRKVDKATLTRLVDGACIFLNREGFPTGPGCALHQVAEERGVPPWSLKPTVCWQVPLRREDTTDSTGHVTSTIGEWGRRHWGEGGSQFHWWCTEAPEAFTASQPVYRYMEGELRELVGNAPFEFLAAHLDERRGGTVPLAHPTLRRAAPLD